MLLGSGFLHCFITKVPKQMKPADYSVPLKSEPRHICGATSSAVSFEHFCFIDTSMAGQGIAKARRSSWLLAQWFSIWERAASILGPKQRARTSLPAVLPCKATGTACKSESCIWPHPPGWHPPDWSAGSHTHLWLERQRFEPSPVKALVKVKLNTKQMLIITEFPQTTLSQLTASSFYLLVMLRSSAPFLPFPCRSIIKSCPCFSRRWKPVTWLHMQKTFPCSPFPIPASHLLDPQAVWLLHFLISLWQQRHI